MTQRRLSRQTTNIADTTATKVFDGEANKSGRVRVHLTGDFNSVNVKLGYLLTWNSVATFKEIDGSAGQTFTADGGVVLEIGKHEDLYAKASGAGTDVDVVVIPIER